MPHDQPQEFPARIAACTHHRNLDRSRLGHCTTSIVTFILFPVSKLSSERHEKREGRGAFPWYSQTPSRQRLEYWKRFRAPFCPYFLRSLTRESRRRRASLLSGSLRDGFIVTRALAIACLSAPACPVEPPPQTVARTSYFPAAPVTSSGNWIRLLSEGLGKQCSKERSFTTISPDPGETHVLAIAHFR